MASLPQGPTRTLTRVRSVNSESDAVSSSSYSPGAENVALVRAAPGIVNVTVPGPVSISHSTTRPLPLGNPSSCALPNRFSSSFGATVSTGGLFGRAVTPRTRTVGRWFRQTPFGTLA